MSDSINHPQHYAGIDVTIECIDLTRHLNFQLGNAVKYLWRAGKKGGKEQEIEDLRKALWYLQDYLDHPGLASNSEAAAEIAWLCLKNQSIKDDGTNIKTKLVATIILHKDKIPDVMAILNNRIRMLEEYVALKASQDSRESPCSSPS
ncbi:MAG: hypothetical protein BWY49_00108 [Candidatus Omnitrophica bacterium ADurb.Bin314]|nr:MAG: hypothetical protein BWY49_00108 [Candidatus Omnitrophica bacterium ADurb.Bin314]